MHGEDMVMTKQDAGMALLWKNCIENLMDEDEKDRAKSKDWRGSVQALECALHLENTLHKSLLELHHLAAGKSEPHVCDFLPRHYLRPQGQVLMELGKYWTVLRKLGPRLECLADYLLGRLMLDIGDKED
ncbi:Ferritin heavy chain [Heterocephalus glaber]|uniref:Ferritin n=1 Tax=Heterocephalus glaber TaxID=10181 RepID=G5B793_HETGA|nr:Ferritin heavy chain [Heterocephalus glaber]